ncbi:MAG TPA: hypothetical protein DCR40_18505 [Prolixibacteraceae bacterium]|nr:hypothetical protein [Prolixibacteraceae bacterium]
MRIKVLILLLTLFNLELASQERSKTFSLDCDTLILFYPCFSAQAWEYLSNEQVESLRNYSYKVFQNNKITLDRANAILNSEITMLGLCSKNKVDKRFMQSLDERKYSNSLKLVFQEYCLCSFKNGKWVSTNEQIKNYYWLYKEYFCIFTRDLADKITVKAGASKDSSIRFENMTVELCNSLRNDEISIHDAYYRYYQEFTRYRDNIWPEYRDWIIDQIFSLDFKSLFQK